MDDENRMAAEGRAAEADAEGGDDLLELLSARSTAPPKLDGVVIGILAGFDGAGAPLVGWRGFPGGEPRPARSLAALDPRDEGCEVALMFEGGDATRPILMGVIQDSAAVALDAPAAAGDTTPGAVAEIDGERVTLTGKEEIVLRCGRASITLTSAGKILIRGAYLSSRSSGVNRIKGGSVQIN